MSGTTRKYWKTRTKEIIDVRQTTLRCRRRPGRKPCGTLLTIFFDIDTNDVLWFCPRCNDEGRIAGWEDTFWDNGNLAEHAS